MSAGKTRRFDRRVDGIVLLDKPSGMTSNAALQRARSLFRAEKAGHAGSLDPMATGMLPICFGHATKVCAFLLDERKSYRFVAKLGERSDTGDADGNIVERLSVPALDEKRIREVLAGRVGEQRQTPPMYSALKHEGKRLYELARRGEEVDRAPRTIVVERIELLRASSEGMEIEVRCSKGTYVRTLAEDIAIELGTVAHLTALRRIQVDPFPPEMLRTLDQLEVCAQDGRGKLESTLLPADSALIALPTVKFDAQRESLVLRGQNVVADESIATGSVVRMYGPGPRFLGIGEVAIDARVQPRRLFVDS